MQQGEVVGGGDRGGAALSPMYISIGARYSSQRLSSVLVAAEWKASALRGCDMWALAKRSKGLVIWIRLSEACTAGAEKSLA